MVFHSTNPTHAPQPQLTDPTNPNSSSSSLSPRIILPSRRSSFSGVEEVEPKGLAPQRSHPNLAASIKSSKKKTPSLRRRSLDSELGRNSDDERSDKLLANDKRNKEFHALFKSVPLDDTLIEDYGCALQKEILVQGRIYISRRHLCFNANIFGWITNLVIAFTDIVEIEKRTTAIFIPNAILISTNSSKHFFASFLSREHAYEQMVTIWQQAQQRVSSITVNNSLKKSSDDGNSDNDDDTDDDLSFTDWVERDHDNTRMKRTVAVDNILALSPPSQPVNNNDNDRQSSQASLPILSHTNDEVDAARRRAISEAGPRPTADSIVQRSADEHLPTITLSKAEKAKEFVPPVGASSSGIPALSPHQQQQHHQTQCKCTETADDHYPNVVMDQVYQCSMETLYNIMYHSEFVKKYLTEVQRSTGVTMSPWRKVDDIPFVRDVSYVKYLGGAIGPKSTRCILKEELTHVDLDNSVTHETTTQTPDVPSGSSFCVKTRMCMSWAGQGRVRMLVTVAVPFGKSSWLKSTIERASIDGQVNYFRGLDAAIRKYTETRHDETTYPKKHRHGKRKGSDRNKGNNDKRKTADNFTSTTNTTNDMASSSISSASGILSLLSQLANDGIQMVGDLLTVPPTMTQCIVVCLLLMVITNMYIALKMVNMGQQLYTFHHNNPLSSARGYRPSTSPLEVWRQKHRQDVDSLWQWLEKLEEKDPWMPSSSSPRNQQEESSNYPQQHHNGSPSSHQHHHMSSNHLLVNNGHHRQRHSSPQRLDQLNLHHFMELEKLVQHTEQNVDQVYRSVLQQRTKLMELA